MPEHLLRANGRTLCVLEAGDPGGRAVFALHGTPGSRLLWHGLVEDAQARGVRILGYDRAGYGGSSRDIGRNVAAAAADVAIRSRALVSVRISAMAPLLQKHSNFARQRDV